eukprot:XP_027304417.1 uncharacterized protein LOC113841923 isoform X2 [Anas platyrhynchos]
MTQDLCRSPGKDECRDALQRELCGVGHRKREGVSPLGVNSWEGISSLWTTQSFLLSHCHYQLKEGNPCPFFLGDLPAPALMLSTFSAQEGQMVLVQCAIDGRSPVTRIVFCKDGVETSSLKAIRGQLTYNVILNVSLGSAGKYTCGYQLKDQSNQVKNSALSVPQDLEITAPHAGIPHTLATGMVLAVAAIGLVLLAAGSWFAIRKGACRGRCPSAQDSSADPSHFYANVDEMGRVKVSSAQAHPCRLSVHVMVVRGQAVGEQMQAKSASDGRNLGALRGCALSESPSFHAPSISPWWAP